MSGSRGGGEGGGLSRGALIAMSLVCVACAIGVGFAVNDVLVSTGGSAETGRMAQAAVMIGFAAIAVWVVARPRRT